MDSFNWCCCNHICSVFISLNSGRSIEVWLEKHNTIPVEIEEGFKNANCVVIMNNHKNYKKLDVVALLKTSNKPCLFIDCWRLFDKKIFYNSNDVIYSGLGVV